MRRTADVTLRLRTAPLLPHRTWLPTHVRSVMNASGHDHNLRRTLTTSASASSSSKKSSQEATGSEDEDYTKLARRPALEQQLQRLEQTAEPVTPRQLTNLLRALIVGKHRDNMDELEPRVLDLHARVHGGTQFDGSALLAALSYMGHLPASFAEYERLKRDGVQLFELNYGYLVEVASAKGDLDRAFTVVDLLREDRHRLIEGRLSTFVFNRLLLACGRNNALDMSSRVIQYLVDEGLRPTPTTFASFIDACAMTGDLHRGLSILRHMKSTLNLSPERYQLDARYFTSLIPACRDPEDFDRVVAEMIREGVEPTENVMEAFIRDCATNGGLSRALGMFKEFRLFCETRSHDRQRKLRQRLQREAEAGASEQRLRALLDEQQQKQRLVVHKPSLSPLF